MATSPGWKTRNTLKDKHNLKILVEKYFIKNVDYTITEIKKSHPRSPGSTIKELILLTPNCFKHICMLSHSKTAIQARVYYLELENLILKYHYMIEDQLNEKIGLLENNQKAKIDIKTGVIYFFEASNISQIDLNDYKFSLKKKKFIKLGKTTHTKNRFNTYNSGNVNDIKPLLIIEVDDINKTEKCLKLNLSEFQYRKKKEIYFVDIDTIKEAVRLCQDMLHGFTKYTKRNGVKKFEKVYSKIKKDGGAMIFISNNK